MMCIICCCRLTGSAFIKSLQTRTLMYTINKYLHFKFARFQTIKLNCFNFWFTKCLYTCTVSQFICKLMLIHHFLGCRATFKSWMRMVLPFYLWTRYGLQKNWKPSNEAINYGLGSPFTHFSHLQVSLIFFQVTRISKVEKTDH